MSVALTLTAAVHDLRDKTVEVSATCSGNYVNSGTTGDVVNLYSITIPVGKSLADSIGFPAVISEGEVVQSPQGFLGTLVPPAAGSATPNLWGLRITNLTSGLEIANGAYAAGLLAPNAFGLRFRGPKARC
jgi:hypothetical protein